jgi:hypothetical protein
VVKFGNSPTVYLVKPDGLHPFDSLASFLLYISNTGKNLKVLSGTASVYSTKTSLAREVLGQTSISYPTGTLINDSGTIYLMRGGQKLAFTNLEAFLGLGYHMQNVYTADLSAYPLSSFQISDPVQEHPWGSWLIAGQTVYYAHQDGLVGVPSWEIFLANGGMQVFIVPANAADMGHLEASLDLPLLSPADPRVSR